MSADDLADRLDAVERALTDEDTDLTDVRTAAALTEEVDRLERRVDELEATVAELDAAIEAVRGYAGNVRAVNRDVERRASAALAKAEALEASVDPETHHDPMPAQQAAADRSAGSPGPNVVSDGPNSNTQGSRSGEMEHENADNHRGREVERSQRHHGQAGTQGNRGNGNHAGDRRQAGESTETADVGDPPAMDDAAPPRDRSLDRQRTRGSEPTETDEEDGTGTEQFIQRVRDAL